MLDIGVSRADVDENGKEPLLADECVPLIFLEREDDGRPPNKRAGVILGVLMVLLVAAGSIVGAIVGSPDWDPRLAPFIEFVEQERGLQFLQPVSILDVDIEEYEDSIRPRGFFRPQRSSSLIEAFRLLGIVDFDPALAEQEALREQGEEVFADGLYVVGNPGRIILPQDLPEAALPLIIVNQLTHALQDQHGLLERIDVTPQTTRIDDSDNRRFLEALIEGDATRIENAYYEQMSPEERAQFVAATESVAAGVRSPFTTSERYTIGAPLTQLIVERDGIDALHDLLRSRGEGGSTELFVDVLGNDGPSVNAALEIDLPPTVDAADGEFGAFGWFLTLAPHVGVSDAFDAVIGFDADAFAIFDNPEVRRTSALRTCIRSDVFFDSAADATEFAEIVAQIGIEGEVREERQSATVDICERLGQPDAQTPAAIFPLILVNELAVHHLQAGESQEVASCAALTQAKTVDLTDVQNDFTSYDPYFEEAGPFVEACR